MIVFRRATLLGVLDAWLKPCPTSYVPHPFVGQPFRVALDQIQKNQGTYTLYNHPQFFSERGY